MKKKMKNSLLSVLLATTATTAVAGAALIFSPNVNSATAETQTTRFEMVDGASIRFSEPLGMRFIAELGEKEYAELATGTKTMGVFVMQYSDIDTDEDGTIDVTDYAGVSKKLNYEFYKTGETIEKGLYEYTDEESGETYYRANAVIDLSLKNYAKEFVGVGYIAETVNGNTTYEYTDISYSDNVRTAAYVAIEAHADPDYKEIDNAMRAFTQYIDGAQLYSAHGVTQVEGGYSYLGNTYATLAEIKNAITDYAYGISLDKSVKYVKEDGTAQLNATLSDTLNNVTFKGAHAVYRSSDESVVKVDKTGKLTHIKNGTATITAEFMGKTQTCEVISGAIDFNDNKLPSYVTEGGRATVSVVDGALNVKAQDTSNDENNNNNARAKLNEKYMDAMFEDEDIAYMAFDLKFASDFDTTKGSPKTIYYRNYTSSVTWTTYCDYSYNESYETAPIGYYQTYYMPRSAYEACLANNVGDRGVFVNLGAGILEGGEGYYIDNIRAVTAEEKTAAYNWYSFEYGGIRKDGTVIYLYDHEETSQWQLQFSGLSADTAKYTSENVTDGVAALTFTKNAGETRMVLNHNLESVKEKELRAAGYIAYDLYVPEGSDASLVTGSAYAPLEKGWNTLYAKVPATDNIITRFYDTTASTYTVDNIRFLTAEEYRAEAYSFETGAGAVLDNSANDYDLYYYDTNSAELLKVQADTQIPSNIRFDTQIVKDGKQSLSFEKTNGYVALYIKNGMLADLKNGFTFWVYSTVGINGTGTSNFGNGVNGKFNGGAGIDLKANEWTQIIVTASEMTADGRFLIIQGSTAGTYYFDGFEPLTSCTVTYEAGEGSVANTTQTVGYGVSYTLATPTSYRDFLGWYNGDELVPTTGTWNISGNVTLTAKYSDKVSFEDNTVHSYFTAADTTGSLSVVDGGTDGNKMLQINANGTSPAMNATVEFLASFFADSDVDYIAFDAKATKSNNNFRRDTKHSNGSLSAVTYEHDMTFTNPVDSVTYPTTGVRADAWKTFYFSRADYDFWVAQGKTQARFIATGGFASGDNIYIDNIRPVTSAERAVSGYNFESVGIRVNDTGGVTLLFYTLDYGTTWQFSMGSKGFTNVGLTSENATDGNSALTFTKAAGYLNINLPSDKSPYNDIATKTGYWAIDVYAPVGSGATVATANTAFSIGGSPCEALVEGAWTTVYLSGSMNTLQITDTNGGTYLIDNMRSITAEEYEANLPEEPEYFYNATGERADNGTVTGLTLQASTHTGSAGATPQPTDTEDMSYYRFNGEYGLDDFLVMDFTGNNMPFVSFFTTGVTNTIYNHAENADVKGWIFANGLTQNNGYPYGNWDGAHANRLAMIGPYKINYKYDDNGSNTALTQLRANVGSATSPNAIAMSQLNGTTDEYRMIIGYVASGTEMHLRILVWNLTTGAEFYSETIDKDQPVADWEGDIVLYGHFGKETVVNKVYPIVEGFDNAKATYTPAMQTYNATWNGNGLTLGKSTYEGSPNIPKVGSTDMSYIAFNGSYGYNDYVVFDFTGSNMPIISFANNEVTNTVFNNASTTQTSSTDSTLWAGIADESVTGWVWFNGLYQDDGTAYGGMTNAHASRLTLIGKNKVLCFDDNSNGKGGGFRANLGSASDMNPLSIRALQNVTETYRMIIGFDESSKKLQMCAINMVTGDIVYQYDWAFGNHTLTEGSITLHGQFGKTTVLDQVIGVVENTTLDALITKYGKDTDYSDEDPVVLNRYAYSGPSDGTWRIDSMKYHDKHTDGSTCNGYNCTCTDSACTNTHCTADYVDNRTVANYETYKNAGFNILLAQDSISVSESSWETNGKLIMDKAHEAGLKVILTDGRIQDLSEPVYWKDGVLTGTAWTIGSGGKFSSTGALDAYIYNCLSLYKDHPAFYGVMLGDEPTYHNAYCYGEVYKSIKRVMPECYVQWNLNPLWDSESFVTNYLTGETGVTDDEAIVAAYKSYVELFIDSMGVDYVQYDAYPFKASTERKDFMGVTIYEKTTPYIMETTLRNIQAVAEIAKERGIDVKVVTQSLVMRSGGSSGDIVTRQVTEDDARWLNNYLMGFGVKQISYFTYWTKAANSSSGEWFDDGGSFVKRDGTTTALYDFMKTIMANNTAFAPTISHFDYNGSKVVTNSYQYASGHIAWGTLSSDSFKWVTGATTSTDATLVTELYDKENYNYMYMVMNTIDPNEKNANSKDTTQTITVTLDSSITEFYVYDQSGNRSLVTTGNTYTVLLTAGQAVYLLPKF